MSEYDSNYMTDDNGVRWVKVSVANNAMKLIAEDFVNVIAELRAQLETSEVVE